MEFKSGPAFSCFIRYKEVQEIQFKPMNIRV